MLRQRQPVLKTLQGRQQLKFLQLHPTLAELPKCENDGLAAAWAAGEIAAE